ncbi:tetratricopeptide repeat protein [Streptomyces sp. NPDC001502]|uniref:tetratricopeptide repeat protein n=1 Tax=Streptomyces sp. NPDC001502 TaxID=3364578 RepID=UPI003684C102
MADSVVYGSVVQVQWVGGDVSVHAPSGERPLYRVCDFPEGRPVISANRARNQPARLLQARYAVVDFIGRQTELQDLAAWRDSDDSVSVLLLHGSGGQGKTRLATQFAQVSRDLGWQALQARHAADPVTGPALMPGGLVGEPDDGAGVLMFVDYAERWPTADLLELCADAARQDRARVLLGARPAGVWWQTLSNDLDRMDIETAELALHALADDPAIEPETLFNAARDRFAAILDIPGVGDLEAPPAVLENPDFRQVLAVHMAALAVVDAHHRSFAEDRSTRLALSSPAKVSAYLLTRERSHWEKLHTNGGVSITADALGHTAYTAALTGSQPYVDGLEAIERVGIASAGPGDRILKDHAIPYPPLSTDGSTVLEPLYPDRLAEDFLALTLPGHTVHTYSPDPWCTDAPRRLLAPPPADTSVASGPPTWTRRTLTVLIAAASRWPHVITHQLAPLLIKHPQLVLQAGGAALASLANLPELDPQILEAIEPCLPEGRHTDLDPGSAAVAYRLAHHHLAQTQDPLAHARVLTHLAGRLHYAGLRDEALTAAQDAQAVWRTLDNADRAAYEPDLAAALIDLGTYLSNVGRQDEAVVSAREAVDIYRRLAEANPAAYEPNLARALTGLGNCLSQAGREGWDALDPALDAAVLWKRLAEEDPATYEPDHAMSCTNLGTLLLRAGLPREALISAREAVDIYRRLAEASPATYEPDFAAALTNLGTLLPRAGREEEAVAPAREAVDIYRRLAEASPATYEPNLAAALNNLGNCLSHVRRPEEAVVPAREAVDIYRRLAEASPAAYEPNLAKTLTNLGRSMLEVAEEEMLPVALEAVRESVALFHGLAQARPGVYDGYLRAALAARVDVLDRIGRTEEAARMRRRLANESDE